MIAWRAPLPACLPVVDLPMPPRPCRLVGRSVERAVFVLCCSVMVVSGDLPLCSSRCPVSVAWLMSLADCSDELPSCLILFACYRCSSRPASRFPISASVSLRLTCPRCVFLVFFFVSPLSSCDCLICHAPVSFLVSSSRLVVRLVVRLGRRRPGSPCACLMRSRWRSRLVSIRLGRAGRGAGRDDKDFGIDFMVFS